MPFPFDKYPWLNFQELNLAYFIKHFREIFEQWNTLLNEMYAWKNATDEELAEWKSTVETGISSWETGLQQSMEDWKDETEADISTWEAATLTALDAWKDAATAVFEQIRTEAAASAQAAAGSASSAQTALAGAQAAQAAAEATAAEIQSEAAQIQTNTTDIAGLKAQMNDISAPGKNLFNKNDVQSFDARLTNSNQGAGVIKATTGAKTIFIPCLPNTAYTISKVLTNQFSFGYTEVTPALEAGVPFARSARTSTEISITTSANALYLVAYVYLNTESNPESLTFEQVCDSIQIELGDTATPYEPYELSAIDKVARAGVENNAELIAANTDKISEQADKLSGISAPGKNLFDKNDVQSFDARLTNSNQGAGVIKATTGAKTIFIPCLPNTAYTISKVLTNQFSFGYTEVEPALEAAVPYARTARTSTEISITTGAYATYLVAYVYLNTESNPESLTFEQVCDSIQIELGDTATQYVPYKISAVDDVAREKIAGLDNTIAGLGTRIDTKKAVITSDNKIASLGEEMIADFSAMTAIGGASYSDGVWDLPVDGGISTTLNVDADTTYLIQLGIVSGSIVISDYSTNLRVNPLTITFGNDSLSIFANGDANWDLCLKPAVSGNATLSIVCEDLLSLKMNGLSVKAVTGYADTPFTINGVRSYMNSHNIAIGNGQTKQVDGDYNTAVGRGAQDAVDTGYANTAVGFSAQNALLNGRANCAVGNNAQSGMTTGMYNNAFGTVCQGNPGGGATPGVKMTGCWNNAMGNEAQRDLTSGHNNTGIGRRAQSYLTTGCENTAFGSLAGFTQINGHGSHGGFATKTANYQTLIGAESIQADSTNGEHDYATALGYRTYVGTKALALGAETEAVGEKSVAIGYGVHAINDNEVVIGDGDSSIILAGKRIIFNQDGTVTWTAANP